MSSNELRVNFSDLTNDAQVWSKASAKLERALEGVNSVNPQNDAFSIHGIATAVAFRMIKSHLSENLKSGCEQYTGLADTLRTAHERYGHAEEFAISRFRDLSESLEDH